MNSHKVVTIIYIIILIILFIATIVTHLIGKRNKDEKLLDISDNCKLALQLLMAGRVILNLWGATFNPPVKKSPSIFSRLSSKIRN